MSLVHQGSCLTSWQRAATQLTGFQFLAISREFWPFFSDIARKFFISTADTTDFFYCKYQYQFFRHSDVVAFENTADFTGSNSL